MAVDWKAVAASQMHPTRVAIVELLGAASGPLSPSKLARMISGETIGRVAYHVGVLNDAGLLLFKGTRANRTTLEHFYTLAPEFTR